MVGGVSNPDLLNIGDKIAFMRFNNLSDDETLIDQKTYTLEMDGNLFIIKNVPSQETGDCSHPKR